MSRGRLEVRRVLALGLLATALVPLAAVPAIGAQSTVTKQDCQNRTITVKGKRLSTAQCLKHVGQSATLVSKGRGSNLAHTGFEVWILGLLGASLVGGALVLRRRTSARSLA
jgi:LPXTG-motif cell wall-anchored protein